MPHKRDMIHSGDFLPVTRQGIKRFCEDHGLEGVYESGSLEHWALLFFKLRAAEDREEWFPSGKWATIQRLESLLEEAA